MSIIYLNASQLLIRLFSKFDKHRMRQITFLTVSECVYTYQKQNVWEEQFKIEIIRLVVFAKENINKQKSLNKKRKKI